MFLIPFVTEDHLVYSYLVYYTLPFFELQVLFSRHASFFTVRIIVRRSRLCVLLFLGYNVLQPDAFLNQYESDHTFDPVCNVDTCKDHNHEEIRKPAQYKSNRYTGDPDKYAVEKERNHCLAAGTEGKICRMQERVLRHKHCLCHDQVFCQMSCCTVSIIQSRKQWRDQKHHNRHTGTAHHGKGDHLVIQISRLIHLAGTQFLSYHDSYRITQCDKDYIK